MLFFSRRKTLLDQLAQAAPHGRSLWADARTRFMRNKAAVVSLVLLLLIGAACIIGPAVLPHSFDSADWDSMSLPPTFKNMHWWGTDESGRDLLVRCLVGGRISLMVGLLATLASVAIGIAWGATAVTAGYLAGESYHRVEKWLGRGAAIIVAVIVLIAVGVWAVRRHRAEARH